MPWDDVEVVTLQSAMDHARISVMDEHLDLEAKLRQAHELVLDHVSRDDDDWTATMEAWTPTTAPKVIQAAVHAQFQDLCRYRGDDEPSKASPLTLSPYVTRLLLRYHDPALA